MRVDIIEFPLSMKRGTGPTGNRNKLPNSGLQRSETLPTTEDLVFRFMISNLKDLKIHSPSPRYISVTLTDM